MWDENEKKKNMQDTNIMSQFNTDFSESNDWIYNRHLKFFNYIFERLHIFPEQQGANIHSFWRNSAWNTLNSMTK